MNDLQILIRNEVRRTGAKAPYVCLFCGTTQAATMKYGAFIPQDPEDKARLMIHGKITVWLYSCCPLCAKRPDLMKAIGAKISTPNGAKRTASIELYVPQPKVNLKSKETIQ